MITVARQPRLLQARPRGSRSFFSAEHGVGEVALRDGDPGKAGAGASRVGRGEGRRARRSAFVSWARPNVGKSSLSNRLIKSDRLIVNHEPGTTRDRHRGAVRIRGSRRQVFIRSADRHRRASRPPQNSPPRSNISPACARLTPSSRTDVVFLGAGCDRGRDPAGQSHSPARSSRSRSRLVIVVNKWDKVHDALPTTGGRGRL